MRDQIEFCNVLVLNKCDLVDVDDLQQLEAVLQKVAALRPHRSCGEWPSTARGDPAHGTVRLRASEPVSWLDPRAAEASAYTGDGGIRN